MKEIAAKEAAGEELNETEKLMKTWGKKKKGEASEGTKEQRAALKAGMKLAGAAKEPKEKTQWLYLVVFNWVVSWSPQWLNTKLLFDTMKCNQRKKAKPKENTAKSDAEARTAKKGDNKKLCFFDYYVEAVI